MYSKVYALITRYKMNDPHPSEFISLLLFIKIMKVKYIPSAIAAALLFSYVSCGSSSTPEMQKYKARQEILNQNLKLNLLKMNYEEERIVNSKLREEARSLSEIAEDKSNRFGVKKNAEKVADHAAETQKHLNRAEKAIRELVKSDRKLEKIQRQIDREQAKADGMIRQIEYVKPE